MKNTVLYIITLLLALVNNSCELEKELEFKGYGEFSPAIVVHGFISPNNGVEVAIRKTQEVDKVNSYPYLDDAGIVLFEDGLPLFHLTEIDSGFFVSPYGFTPSTGKGYHIEASAPGFEKASSATQFILPEIPVDSLVLINDSISHQGHFLRFRFNDPPDINNYYHVNYMSSESPEPVYNAAEKASFILGSFDDVEFDGDSTWQTVQYYDNINSPENIVINLYLFNISEEFNKFLNSLDEYEYTRQTIFFPVTSPVYSNITGGFGIFTSYTYTSKHLIID